MRDAVNKMRIFEVAIIVFALLAVMSVPTATAGFIKVPEDYPTIQQAIHHVTPDNRTVIVNADSYDAIETIIVNKSDIILKSVNGRAEVSAGGASDHVFNISNQKNVTVKGFRVGGANGTSQSVVGIWMVNATHCNISNSVITNISGTDYYALGIDLRNSHSNNFRNIRISDVSSKEAYGICIAQYSDSNNFTNTRIRYINGDLYASGVYLKINSNNNTFDSTVIENVTSDRKSYGIDIRHSDSNSFMNSCISDCNSNLNASGIRLRKYSNSNTFDLAAIENITASDGNAYGIFLVRNSDSNSFENISISPTISGGNDWYEFFSDQKSADNVVNDLTIGNSTLISYIYANGIGVKRLVAIPSPSAPPDKVSIGKYVNVTNVTTDSWVFLNVSYSEADIREVNESSLVLYRWDATVTAWEGIPGGVNTTENYVYGNISVFSPIAPFGDPTHGKAWYVDDSGGTGIDFTSIQDAIDNATAGDTIIVYNGTYQENVKVTKQLNLTGIGMPVVDAGGSSVAIALSADGCLLRGFTAVNSGTNKNDAGIYVESDNNLIIDNAACSNYKHGIYFCYSNNNTLLNNNASSNYRFGLYFKYSSNNILLNNNANLNNDNGIHLYKSNNNTILNNNANSNMGKGISLCKSNNNTLLNNTAKSNNNPGISLDGSSYNNVSNNNVSNKAVGVYLGGSRYNTISNNNANLNSKDGTHLENSEFNIILSNNFNSNCGNGILLSQSNGNTISNNTANSNNEDGISLWNFSDYNLILNNSASNNDDGIYIRGSGYNTISNNDVSNNDDGIYFKKARNNTLSNNIASNNLVGINLVTQSSNNNVSNNNASNNKFYGFHLLMSYYNVIFDNTANSNKKNGIFLYNSSKNLLYHNNLVNNTNSDARDDDGNNQWYTATLREGNFYSDYTGADVDRDGIGDTPYIILGSSGSQDLYPLMHPFETKPTVSISIDKFEYSPGDAMSITISLENPAEIEQQVIFTWYLILPGYNLSYEIMSEELVLTAGFNRSFVIPLDVEYWAPIGFNATWYVTLHNSTTSEIIAQSTANWMYSLVTKHRGKLKPSEIAEEIVNKVAVVELPG